ncbi:MAG: hypothetical protein U9O54_04195 [Chloroflexota bacterium]|nr:hypothetical protein [Chloroflexota bacterium]
MKLSNYPTNKLYGVMMFVLVIAIALVVSLTRYTTWNDISSWEPIPVHTLTCTPTPVPGWWDEKPTPSLPTLTPMPTLTPTTTE